MVRSSSGLCILTWKRASRHNGVYFFMSHLASWLRTRRSSEPTFRPSGATNHWKKHSESRFSYLFAHLLLLSSDSFSSNLSLLSASALLCFSSVHIVGSLTSKFLSITSSITQGGGGSFKNRKPIGEIGCCELRMAERSHWWNDRWLRSLLFLSVSYSFSDYLPIYLPIYLSIYLCICLSIYYLSI